MPEKLFVAAKAAILKDGKILLIEERRGDNVSYDFPGGRVDSGESPPEGLARELLEEIGVVAKSMSELPIAVWNEQRRDAFIFLLYKVELSSEEFVFEITSDGGVQKAEYFSYEDIEKMENFVRKEERLPSLKKVLN